MRPTPTIKFIETCCWFLSKCGMRVQSFRVIKCFFSSGCFVRFSFYVILRFLAQNLDDINQDLS